jgi:hypothetical protein
MSYTAYIYAACVCVFAIILMYWSNKHPDFVLTDLVTGDNGKVSLRKFGALVALFSSTWVFVTLTEQGKLTEWFFTGYIAVWAAQKVVTDVMSQSK